MSHGGKRTGSGRKRTTGKTTRTLSCTADRDSYDLVVTIARAKGQTVGQFLRDAIMSHCLAQPQLPVLLDP